MEKILTEINPVDLLRLRIDRMRSALSRAQGIIELIGSIDDKTNRLFESHKMLQEDFKKNISAMMNKFTKVEGSYKLTCVNHISRIYAKLSP